MINLRGLLSLGRRLVPLEQERAIRQRLDSELTRLSRRAIDIAGALLMKAPRLEAGEGFEVRPVDEGWMIFEKASTLPVKLYVRKVDAVKEARKLAAPLKVKVRIFKKPRLAAAADAPLKAPLNASLKASVAGSAASETPVEAPTEISAAAARAVEQPEISSIIN